MSHIPCKNLTIGTHDGVFHCDEVFACSMLLLLHPSGQIIRSRDPNVLDKCDIVVDVGGVYDHSKRRYDHHQRDFNHSMKTLSSSKLWSVKLSSAGLIFYHYGTEILKHLLKSNEKQYLDYVQDKVYENFVQEIDGIDNGIPMYEGEPLYYINTHLSKRIGSLNKAWNSNDLEFDEENSFRTAMDIVLNEFTQCVSNISKILYPARKIVMDAIENRYDLHESGEIIELSRFCPWKDHLFELETQLNIQKPIKFVLFASENSFRVQAVSINKLSFVCRKFLHEKWRGLRDEKLKALSGIDGCIFVHSNGFIGGNNTKEGALQMAIKTLEYNNSE